MKKVLVMMAVAMLATVSFAWISISWDAYGFTSSADSSVYASQDTDTTQLLWDLVYTTAGSAAKPQFDTTTGEISYGSDTLLSSRLWKPGSSDVRVTDVTVSSKVSTSPLTLNLEECFLEDAGVYNNPDFDASAGKLYTAIFQYMQNGDVYYEITDAMAVGGWDGSGTTPLPSKVCFDMSGETQISKFLGTVEEPTAVPEPATMSLLGLGALAMVLRRKLRK